ncbi:MAG: hypothetical protein BJ554DRAFT_2157 [Olpidium bornovanus]|uniref:Uncharacterized protein n=1 Tax=Olpidium bornovanus TaxID=278681 RepID=A0A8H7ZQX6_9FUNG|nr:MAG: hypothetical protein BJ554DRAFT_2157 [Olpidium bornovanus]
MAAAGAFEEIRTSRLQAQWRHQIPFPLVKTHGCGGCWNDGRFGAQKRRNAWRLGEIGSDSQVPSYWSNFQPWFP